MQILGFKRMSLVSYTLLGSCNSLSPHFLFLLNRKTPVLSPCQDSKHLTKRHILLKHSFHINTPFPAKEINKCRGKLKRPHSLDPKQL